MLRDSVEAEISNRNIVRRVVSLDVAEALGELLKRYGLCRFLVLNKGYRRLRTEIFHLSYVRRCRKLCLQASAWLDETLIIGAFGRANSSSLRGGSLALSALHEAVPHNGQEILAGACLRSYSGRE